MTEIYRSLYTVTVGDINYSGHLGHERAFTVFHDARIRFLASLGLSEMDIGDGVSILVVEVSCHYRQQVVLHDQLEVVVELEAVEGRKIVFTYRAVNSKTGKEAFQGRTVMLGFDKAAGKVADIPSSFLQNVRV
ncbi:acyl-CoA thioesterase [Desulforhopalus singaporensis]|uniref:Thioesterase-like superfamily protein n=1 Tax=Desulforhopalus singaporensis TaxID=91360 RepID=A0A1H0RVD5_9BACT|nr:thioesterase family protein [Desulforhopalus singaporensis]SDP33319.1 Thioesterase-like superfamily protein [Desulforhopalus singaporensis]